MSKKNWIYIILAFFLFDFAYSSMEYYYSGLDGDITSIVVPAKGYDQVLKDPFGWELLKKDSSYSGTNRFFIHWSMKTYWDVVPKVFHLFTDPVLSLFLCSAFIKVITYLLIVFLFATLFGYYQGTFNWKSFVLGLALVPPFFQYNSTLYRTIGIIDYSNTYVFFYCFSLALLILYLYPFLKYLLTENPVGFKQHIHILLVIGAIVLPLSGPLNLVVILFICPTIFLYLFLNAYRKEGIFIEGLKRVPIEMRLHFPFIILISLYSYYLSGFNAENSKIPLDEAYTLLFDGIIDMYWKTDFLIIIGFVFCNLFFLFLNRKKAMAKNILLLFFIIGGLSVFYVCSLPLGGYRPYRPDIIRYDVVIPLSLAYIFFYGISSIYLLQIYKYIKYPIIVLVLFLTVKDLPGVDFLGEMKFGTNFRGDDYDCEKKSLYLLYHSNTEKTKLNQDCNVLEWRKPNKVKSDLNSSFLRSQDVLKENCSYYTE